MRKFLYWFLAVVMGAALWILVGAIASHAQTVSPVISEFGKKASGEFTVTNNALVPMGVSTEAMSFTVGPDGKSIFRPLDPGVDVRLSETSYRLGPKQGRKVTYDIRCAAMPCAITIFSTLTGLHVTEGIVLAIHLPTVIYLCPKAKNCRASMRKAWGVAE